MTSRPPICIAVLAHNEEARIAACLNSLPLGEGDVAIHVLVNGSTDATAAIAGGVAATARNVRVHIYRESGKARSWNRFLFDDLAAFHETHIFVDGDAEIIPGSIEALDLALKHKHEANAASGLPRNGRRMARYRQVMQREHGLFGDLYALRGDFLRRMKQGGIRLPDDVIGEDGLICAMAKTDLADESCWNEDRVAVCEGAGFLCAPVSTLSPQSWQMQYRRMVNYSVRHYQNAMISRIMRDTGPKGLPRLLSDIYRRELPGLQPRGRPQLFWFDRLALKRMARAVEPS
ncbi:MAG: glycosyltransferase family 2 protein [Sphingomonadales bacterium]|nr:glycosyltransferase family 2 protein [Sphingomonadales bacterium]MBK9004577.1 glycosyltransferase family 2 protein [Sphingomonadales bacterium]MBK9269766.1 glycosyltransferase family 2 protein [Sphingomonadales bacterium]MBP6433981.1 glycosyltransferase family 2 protein [Sphingorhabdus sp.]